MVAQKNSNSLKNYYEFLKPANNLPVSDRTAPILKNACDVTKGSNIEGYRGDAINGKGTSQYFLFPNTAFNTALNTAKQDVDSATKVANTVGLITAIGGLATTGASIFSTIKNSLKSSSSQTLENAISERAKIMNSVSDQEVKTIIDSNKTPMANAESILNAKKFDTAKAATYSATLTSNNTSLRGKIQSLETENTELDTTMSSIDTEISTLDKSISEHNEFINTTAPDREKTLKQDIAALEELKKRGVEIDEETLKKLQTELTALPNEIKAHETQREKDIEAKKAKEEEKKKLENQKNKNIVDIQAAKTAYEEADKIINQLNNKIKSENKK